MDQRREIVATGHVKLRRKVLHFAICSRLFVLLLSFASNTILPDHNAGVYQFPRPVMNESSADQAIETFLGGLSRWDAQYFLHISHYGYTYENTLAFYPLFPFLTSILGVGLDFLLGSIFNPLSTVLISAVLINLFFFVTAALQLFELSCLIFNDQRLGYISALFFCINPASIFFTAAYSESCFAFLTFSGMLFYLQLNKELLSSLAFGLSACVRSNGLISFGFIAHGWLKVICNFLNFPSPLFAVLRATQKQYSKIMIYLTVFLFPFVVFQCYAHTKFCFREGAIASFLSDYGKSNGYVMPGLDMPPWCDYAIPFSYSYVQSRYWNVGFMRYYELKQIPNFLLALPIIYLVLSNSYYFMLENKELLVSLGFKRVSCTKFQGNNLRPEFFVFVAHAVCLTVFCILFIHIQVTTRMLASSCPVIYWFIALRYKTESKISDPISNKLQSHQACSRLVESEHNIDSFWKTLIFTEKSGDLWTSLVKVYFCFYVIVGTVLFSNFYPWT